MIRAATPNGHIVILGYGTIGQCVLPLLIDRLNRPASDFTIIDRIDPPAMLSPFRESGLTYRKRAVSAQNFAEVLAEATEPGDLLLNLTMGVDSLAVADWCHHHGVSYVDTALEPWEGFIEDSDLPAGERTEYALHQRARLHAEKTWRADGPTAIITHGANPGLVSHFAKAALIEIAKGMKLDFAAPSTRCDWARLAQRTGTKVIHISERDTQVSATPKMPGEFVNTWSIPGFVEEAMMPVELGWGTHERALPDDALEHAEGPRNTIYIDQPAARFQMYSWVPTSGQILGLALPHSENVTISDYLTVEADGEPTYRPTVAFVYLPCDGAFTSLHETMMGGWQEPEAERVIKRDVIEGQDELGVLLLGHGLNGLWYGSQLDIHEARRVVPHSNSTALQVAAGVVASSLWALENPNAGFCEPEDLPHDFVLDAARPYLGRIVCERTDWTPVDQRPFIDAPPEPKDPWQFSNFRSGN
ncbi:saccharopine dehydrogenase C-terminal domain-containing protein [Microbaculum sp. FT89]|uniref:saccharopine dehydrogenase C-terminal domain-containing protein n=1 Tax=Microbaculum sp. FT89 TaxID=3447298 RepID=UPI003F532FBC